MLQSLCLFFLGKIYNINIAYKTDRKTQLIDMSFGSSVHSIVFQLRLVEEKFTFSSASIKSFLRLVSAINLGIKY